MSPFLKDISERRGGGGTRQRLQAAVLASRDGGGPCSAASSGEEWVQDLDFSTLERVDTTFVTPELGSRESDVIWRVRWGQEEQPEERWLYVCLLIEFQSTVDPWMALRVMVYVGLLYQRLLQEGKIPGSRRLPPVLPLVL